MEVPVNAAQRYMAAFDRAGTAVRSALTAVTGDRRARETGAVGAGGDATLCIDADAERLIFFELDRLAEEGLRFTAISEERGTVDYGAAFPLVMIDPIDGSLNAKRGLVHHAVSIALAGGGTMADVVAGYVLDLGTGESFTAWRGGGARLDGVPVRAREHRHPDGRLELLAIETSDSRAYAEAVSGLSEIAFRWRVLGSIAVAICQVAAGRVDAMVNLTRCRAVDMAAAQLIAIESRACVSFSGGLGPDAIPLNLQKHAAIAITASPQARADLESLLCWSGS